MLARWIIIDGNNLVHSDPSLGAAVHDRFPFARNRLVRRMEALLGVLAERITVVFDGSGGAPHTGFESSKVQVRFTSADVSADSAIERLAAESDDPAAVLVVSSDRLERHTVEASGVRSLSCGQFLQEVCRTENDLRASLRRAAISPKPKGRLGDFFPS